MPVTSVGHTVHNKPTGRSKDKHVRRAVDLRCRTNNGPNASFHTTLDRRVGRKHTKFLGQNETRSSGNTSQSRCIFNDPPEEIDGIGGSVPHLNIFA